MRDRLHIILIENNPEDARLVQELIGGMKTLADILSTDSLSVAMEYLEHDQSIDIVLLSLSLPDDPGMVPLMKIRALAPQVPVIVLLDNEDEKLGIEALRNGAQDYLVKGRNNGNLLSRSIRHAIELSEIQKSLRQTETELQEYKRRLESLYQGTRDGILVLASDGSIAAANPSACRMLGRDEKEIREIGLAGIADPEVVPLFDILEELNHNRCAEKDYSFIRKDGTILYATISFYIFTDKDGHDWTNVIIRDTSGQKLAEEEIRKREGQFRKLVEKSEAVVVLYDGEGRRIYVSPAISDFLGYSPEEFLLKSTEEIFHPDEIAAAEARRTYSYEHPAEAIPFTRRIRHKNGTWRWIEGSARNLLGDPNVQSVVVNFHDITERKQAEELLLESEERYRVTVENSNDGIGIATEEKHIYVNKRFLEIFGYDKPEELIGKPVSVIMHPDDLERLREYHRGRMRGEKAPDRFEFKGIKKDGTEIFLETSVTQALYHGEQVTFAFLRDITDRKRNEAALRESA